MHGSKSSDSPTHGVGQRPRRRREPDQASRGGLAGSDASGRTLGALGLESRGRRRKGRKHRGGGAMGQRHSGRGTRHRRDGTAGRAEVAGVRARGAVVVVPGCRSAVIVVGAAIGMAGVRLVGVATAGRHRHVLSIALGARMRRAQHGRSHHAPNGKHDSQQHEQQDANDSHGTKVSRRGFPIRSDGLRASVDLATVGRSSGQARQTQGSRATRVAACT